MLRQLLLAIALWVLCAFVSLSAVAQTLRPRRAESLTRPRRATVSGILTDRLSSKALQRWNVIERLVFVEDSHGQPFHPTLRALWEWAETSGHIIYIEISNPGRISTCTAGSFSIERFDPRGEKHVAVIRLHLSNIDQAYVGSSTAHADGFMPFEGLNKEERYAEVLGHELAHAAYILTSQERAQKVEELVEQTNDLLLSNRKGRSDSSLGPDMRQRLIKRDSLLKDLEAQAESMEAVVWRELLAGQKARAKN